MKYDAVSLMKRSFHLTDALRACRERIRVEKDGEALHDYRVATRRLSSMLAPFAHAARFTATRKPLHQLKRCLKRSNELRDLEVLLALLAEVDAEAAQTTVGGWKAEQTARQSALHGDLLAHITSQPISQALRQLEMRLPDALAGYGAGALRRAVQSYYTSLCINIDRRLCLGSALFEDPAQWHGLRVDCKRLRYICESHGDLLGERCEREIALAKRAQDGLGELRDLDILFESLAKSPEQDAQLMARLRGLRAIRLSSAASAVEKLAGYFSEYR